jgi:beta-phosphoglucomutase-like phosphatase (HAD superfamily)
MALPCRPSAVVFDMDGLLFDTEALYQKAIMAAAVQGGHDTSSGIFEHAIGRTWDQTRAMLREHFGAAFPVEEFIAAMARNFDEMALTRLVMKPGVVELLDTLDELKMPRPSLHLPRIIGRSTIWSHTIWSGVSMRLSDMATTRPASPHPIPF